MSGAEVLDSLYKGAEILVFVGGALAMMWRVSAAVTKFEHIGKQQAAEIADLKHAVDRLTSIGSEIGRFDERLMATGRRLDELTRRFNAWSDRPQRTGDPSE